MIGLAAVIDQVLKFEAEAVSWLPGPLVAEVVGHSCIVTYGLVTVVYSVSRLKKNHSFILLQI